MESSIPLPEYASKLEEHVKQRYVQKISSIVVDPAFEPVDQIVYPSGINRPSTLLGFGNKLLRATTI